MSDKNIAFENYLGKPFNELKELGEVTSRTSKFCVIEMKPGSLYFGETCYSLQISLNEKEESKSLSIGFPRILDREFYDEMVSYYGFPKGIFAKDKLISETKSNTESIGGFHQNLSKRQYSMKEVNFDNNPFMVIWKRNFYEIKMTFYYKENGTQLVFNKR